RVPAHREKVQLGQVLDRADLVVLLRMPEPARADGYVRFTGAPDRAVRMTVLERLPHPGSGYARIGDHRGVHGAPVGVPRDPSLVADPANVRAGVGEHDRLGLQRT